MTIGAFFFDLDGTLYDSSCGLMKQVNRRIDEWILRTVHISEFEVSEFRRVLFTKYGGTLPGLTIEYGSDFFASLRYCHDIPVGDYVSPNPVLRDILKQLPGHKYIFTSAYRFYAVKVLDAIGILDCFDGIIDAIDVFPYPKPAPEAYRKALQITAEPEVWKCAFLDDQPRNVAAGNKEGFFSVQVGTEFPRSESADAQIDRIEYLLRIPEFKMEG